MNRVDGKVAIVTGAGRGIGQRAAELLAENGAKVVLTDIDEGGASAAESIVSGGGEALFLRHDVTSESEWEGVVNETVERFGKLDVLVNNAGIFFYKRIEEMSLDEWQRITHVNLDGVFLGTKYAIRAMKENNENGSPSRSIVNLSSIAGLVGGVLGSAYHMTQGGVRLFTKSSALECAALGYNIRVNSVHPGVIETAMGDQVVEDMVASGLMGDTAEVRESVTAFHPLGRLGTVDEVAKAIVFLASDDSSFMTGTELVVDGGFTAR